MIRCFEHHSSFFVLYIRCFDVAFGWKLSSHCLKEIFCQISTNFKQISSFSSNKLYYFLWSNIAIFFEQISFISNTHYHFFKRGVFFSSHDYFTFGENIIWNLWQAFGESFPHLDFPSQKVCDINGTVYHDWISRIKGGKESGSFFSSQKWRTIMEKLQEMLLLIIVMVLLSWREESDRPAHGTDLSAGLVVEHRIG